MPNSVRQAQFQARNPGYDQRRKARQRALRLEAARVAAVEDAAVAVREPLCLPAPVEPIVFPWTVEEVRQRAMAEQREAVLVER